MTRRNPERRGTRILAWLLPCALVACGETAAPPDGVPTRIESSSGNGQSGTVGQPLAEPLVVRVLDRSGTGVPDADVVFVVVQGNGSVAADERTDENGRAVGLWTLGTSTTVEQRLEVRLAGHDAVPAAVFNATAQAAPPASFSSVAGNGQSRVAGVALRDSLVVRLQDAFGNGVPDVRVDWIVTDGAGLVSPSSMMTDANGRARTQLVLGPEPGHNAVSARTDGFEDLTFDAVGVPPPVLASVQPDTLVPGRIVTFEGTGFAAGLTDTEVFVSGVRAFLVQSTATRVAARIPCVASGDATVELITNGGRVATTQRVSVSPVLRLDPGMSAHPEGPLSGCLEIAAPGAHLLVVARTMPAPPADIRIRGQGGGPHAAQTAARTLESSGDSPHERRFAAAAALAGLGRAPWTATAPDPAVGEIVSMRIPAVATDPCLSAAEVSARVVAAGARTLLLEDVEAPLAGTADSILAVLHDELETQMLPLLEANFGAALAAIADGGGPRLRVLLTPVVNALPGVAGFTSVGDLLDPASCGGSNGVPVFYGNVPTDPAAGYGNGLVLTRANWYRLVRATVVHELKHLIAFATRLRDNELHLEERWLEEGTALFAEELYARQVFGYDRNDNVGFRESLFCERRPDSASFPDCRDRPLIMLNHFTLLSRHLLSLESRSSFNAAAPGDNAYYGAAWSFLNWILAHHATDEAAFLRALTGDIEQIGRRNLEARSGRPFDELFTGWLAALALDDRNGLQAADPGLGVPAWNLRDIYAGLQQELPLLFPRAFPLAPRTTNAGAFEMVARTVPGGGAVMLEIGSAAATRQLLEILISSGEQPRPLVVRLN